MIAKIYADNAATTALDEEAYNEMRPYLIDDYSNPSQPYAFSRDSKKAIYDARKIIADCIGASTDEIYFTSGGTESDNWVIKGISKDHPGSTIITTQFEHHAILNSCHSVGSSNDIIFLKPDGEGIIKTEELKKAIHNNTALTSIMFVNNELGTIQPIKELCEIAHSNGSLFHTDAVQAVGHMPINVKELGVDFLSASAHKFNGPKGVGFLYIKKGTALPPLIDGGSQENGLRAGTENVANIVAMSIALRNNTQNISENQRHINNLEHMFFSLLDDNKVEYHINANERMPGIMSLSFPHNSGESLMHSLDLMGIYVSTGSACDSMKTDISHVLKAIELNENLAKNTIRISLGKNNTVDDVGIIVNCLSKLTHSGPFNSAMIKEGEKNDCNNRL